MENNFSREAEDKRFFEKCHASNRKNLSCLITDFGTIVFYDEKTGNLTHGSFLSSPKNVFLARERGGVSLRYFNKDNVEVFCIPPLSRDSYIAFHDDLAILIYDYQSVDGNLNLKSNDRWLCAEPDGFIGFTREQNSYWENFRVIPLNTLLWLNQLLNERWICLSGDRLNEPEIIKMEDGLYFDFGCLRVSIDGHVGPIVHIVDYPIGNKVRIISSDGVSENFHRILPLVYYCVYGGDNYYKYTSISIYSLIKLGNYKGAIVVISDRSLSETRKFFTDSIFDNIIFQEMKSESKIFSRFEIEGRGFEYYAPIVYLDVDIVVSKDINQFVCEAVINSGIHVALEGEEEEIKMADYIPLPHSQWFGGWLFRNSEKNLNKTFFKINSGSFCFSNIAAVMSEFRTIVACHLYVQNEMIKVFGDQPVMNYIMRQLENPQTELWSKRILFVGGFDQVINRDESFFHVSTGVGVEKLSIMTDILKYLESKW